jgi:hypothetical protein
MMASCERWAVRLVEEARVSASHDTRGSTAEIWDSETLSAEAPSARRVNDENCE